MNFYPFADIETISPRPMLFITGDAAHSREFSEQAYKLAGNLRNWLSFQERVTSTSTIGWSLSRSTSSRRFSGNT